MKYLTILYICALALFLSSCSESTTNPNTKNNTVNNTELQINGSITFMPDVVNQDLSKAKVAVMWLPQTEDGDPVIWGIGTVNAASKTYSITVDNSVPMSIFMPLSGKIDGYINIGFIMLFWDDNLHNGQTMTVEQFLSSQIGMVEDRSIIYLKGDYKSWNLDFLINDFSQGYNYCKGWYTTQTGTNDGWQVTPDLNNQLLKVVSSGIGLAGFKMPNWY
jgi:hypothetical protein